MQRVLSALTLAVTLAIAGDAMALNECKVQPYQLAATLLAANARDCTIGYAIDSDAFYVRANGAWTAIATLVSLTGDNGGSFANGTNNEWVLTENSEDLNFAFGTNTVTLSSSTDVATWLSALDFSLSGGAGVLTLTDSASSMVVPNNDATAFVAGGSGLANVLTLDTTTSAQKLMVTGTTTVTALHVDVGDVLFDEELSIGGGAGAVTLTGSAASVVVGDNDTTALDIGSAGATTALRYSSADDLETFTFNVGVGHAAVSVTGAATLDASDCGKPIFVTAAHDGNAITLPALTAVPAGCVLKFHYVGADAGALLDISPNASDGIEGGCTLAASVVTFSGTDDADIGLTKASILTGDTVTLTSGNADDWYASGIQGICANN